MPAFGRRARSYLSGWRWPDPEGVVGRDYFRLPASPQVSIHRRAFLGLGMMGSRAAWGAWAARQAWLVSCWYAGRWRTSVASIPDDELAKVSERVRVPLETLRDRMTALARAHAIPPRDSLALGLLRDGMSDRWPDYVFSREVGWNAAASSPEGRRHLATLADKERTARILGSVGIPCVPSLVIDVGARELPGGDDALRRQIAVMARGWLSTWPTVHGKRRVGFRGMDAFELSSRPGLDPSPAGGADGDLILRPYQTELPVPDALDWLVDQLPGNQYLIQPRLLSHPAFDGVADPSDVVTVRVITRDTGAGPQLHFARLELPLPVDRDRQFYVMATLSAQGLVTGPALPPWSRPPAGDARWERVVADLRGFRVPGIAGVFADSIRAHAQFPGLFAAAWDVAISSDGAYFLEGNGGFDVIMPQALAGGLLAGLGSPLSVSG